MYSRFHYVLIALIAVIIYLVYLIVYYKFNEYQADNFETSLKLLNQEIEERNAYKEAIQKYIHTAAYKTQVAKATQNKKLPGEELINIIGQEDADSNHDRDVDTVLAEIA